MSKSQLCNNMDGRLPISRLPHPSSRKSVTVVNYDSIILEEYNIVCFTDGSKLNGQVDLAFVVYENRIEKETIQHRIPDDCSVFKAELVFEPCYKMDSKLSSIIRDCKIPHFY
ncbi:hypothetical protein JTE90_026708 [Oedothorax gibbosus]|uniref:Uncharacterized protein n=1 Tax=Oedothorax gibbosus TaxID=931172 RepID=A0AAV6V037_9ARAC|nr:hypothetical protein JTE90_026708 [Oedothorax gibbosus]